MSMFDYRGRIVQPTIQEMNADNFALSYGRYGTPGANYTMLRIFQTKTDGSKQYPFLYAPLGASAGGASVLDMNATRNFPVAINAGIFDMTTQVPIGTIIQNSVLIQQGDETIPEWNRNNQMVLTIDNEGNLGYAAYNANGTTLINNGIVSAVHSFCPIVIDYQDAADVIQCPYLENDADAQRQLIGQFGNGDYCILSFEARGFQHSTGMTIPQVRAFCLELGLKFAFNLDGGGSTQTVLGHKCVNTIYENATGRVVPNYIVFNGTTVFS